MRKFILVIAGAAAITACGGAQDAADNSATANASAEPKQERPAYCFFKDGETRGWTAGHDASGNVVVKGQAYRSDSRYKAVLGEPKVEGATAVVSPTIVQNDSQYGAPENWWDIEATIPASAGVQSVTVRCGKKELAKIDLPSNG